MSNGVEFEEPEFASRMAYETLMAKKKKPTLAGKMVARGYATDLRQANLRLSIGSFAILTLSIICFYFFVGTGARTVPIRLSPEVLEKIQKNR